MTFDLSENQARAREAARQFARERVAPHAVEADRESRIPEELRVATAALVAEAPDTLCFVLIVEAVATASASVALAAAVGSGPSLQLAGLRGAPTPDDSSRTVLAVNAVALGVARAALDLALLDLRQSAARAGETDKPHWAVADAATELDAAQLLTYRAAVLAEGEARTTAAAMARLLATAAASRAVDVALRLAGAAAFAAERPLERLARDARALALVSGGEDAQRATAAAGLLPG